MPTQVPNIPGKAELSFGTVYFLSIVRFSLLDAQMFFFPKKRGLKLMFLKGSTKRIKLYSKKQTNSFYYLTSLRRVNH